MQFWFDGKSYSVFKVRSSLMRQVNRALQDAGISMPDAAREIIFPEGVPIRRSSVQASTAEETQATLTAPDASDAATVTTGEGNLESEEADLKRQASASDLPEAKDNLLTEPNRKSDRNQ